MKTDETVTLPRDAVREILAALVGPSYLLRELQAISDIRGDECPIKRVVSAFNNQTQR